MNSLSALKDTSEKELQGLVQMIGSFVNGQSANDEGMMAEVVGKINQSKSLLSFFFPTALDKEKERMTLDILQKMHHSRMQLLDIYTNLKIELVKKSADTLLKAVSMDMQAKLTEFANQKINAMSESIAQSKSSFMQRTAKQEMEIEQYKHSTLLYNRAKQSLEREIDVYFKSIDELLEGFLIALKKEVHTQ
jgi:hypothetical protein